MVYKRLLLSLIIFSQIYASNSALNQKLFFIFYAVDSLNKDMSQLIFKLYRDYDSCSSIDFEFDFLDDDIKEGNLDDIEKGNLDDLIDLKKVPFNRSIGNSLDDKDNINYLKDNLNTIKHLLYNGADINSKDFRIYSFTLDDDNKIYLSIIDYFTILNSNEVIDFLMKELDNIQNIDLTNAAFYAVKFLNEDAIKIFNNYRNTLELLSYKDKDNNNLFSVLALTNSSLLNHFIDCLYNLKNSNDIEINQKIDDILYNKNVEGENSLSFIKENIDFGILNISDDILGKLKFIYGQDII